jgi:hypothetical protein
MPGLGTILKYAVVGYVVLVVLASALGPAGLSPLFSLVVLVAVFLLWRYRNRRTRVEINSHTAVVVPSKRELPRTSAAVRLDALERDLPEDPLASPLLLDLAPLYEHEPSEERARLDEEYRTERARLVACRQALERGEPIDAEVGRVERYVAELRAVVSSAGDDPVESALVATGRAREALTEAHRVVDALDPQHQDVGLPLAAADAALREADGAFAEGRERPLLALRRAAEAERAAHGVARRARRLRGLPIELEHRLDEFDRAAARTERELVRMAENFRIATQQYAPACWTEVRGAAAAAEHAVERARSCRAAATGMSASEPDSAKEELDDAFTALNRARSLIEAVDTHLARLERASLAARDRVAAAERTLQAARTGGDVAEATVADAEAIVARAHEELAEPQPDWLRVVELADQAEDLVGAAAATRMAEDQLAGVLADARTRAERARDAAWAQGLVTEELDSTVRPMLDQMERVYQEAVTADTAADDRDGIRRAIEAYELAEERARATRRQVDFAYADSIDRRARSIRGAAAPSGG